MTPLIARLMAPLTASLIAPFNCSRIAPSIAPSQELRAQKREWLEESKESAKRMHNLQDELRAVHAQHDKALGEIQQLMGELDATRTDLAQVSAPECA